MEQSSQEPAVDVEDVSEASTLPTQITSIDGFFNRKRGRPPKNRFVEVYKSAQHSPQAIFTSFKLERSEQINVVGLTPSSTDGVDNHTVPGAAGHTHNIPSGGTFISDLTPRNGIRKRSRHWAVESQRETAVVAPKIATRTEPPETPRVPPAQPVLFAPNPPQAAASASNKSLERISVVRAAGTFYPENASSLAALEDATDKSAVNGDCSGPEQPEDLSMSRTNQSQKNVTSTSVPLGRNEPGEASLKLLQFKHLIDLYQRQVLLPTFLAAASQPATSNTLDMRLLLENAAQQKMLLINAAAAAAAAGAVAAAATETATATATPMTNAVTPPCAAFVAALECPGIGSAARRTRTRDQDIPTGYLKFRFNEDCGFERCGYRNHQSHFHCNRRDCHYSFCDKTRFVQHTARHERMDTLMGDDFRQYRANMRCAVVDCCYATPTAEADTLTLAAGTGTAPKKSSHFHCRKCDYVCTDSNKVVAHRRLHMRLDYVRSAGFRKISSNESCESPACSYARRHTHYHCTTCDCSVLSRAQLASHRHRHGIQGQAEAAD